MKDQHTKITGYRELSQVEIDLMNEVKAQGVALGDLVFRLRTYTGQPFQIDGVDQAPGPLVDQRWVAIAQTDLQRGLMALTRAIAQPTTF